MLENRLKVCREELGMTQTELGYIFGVTKQTVSNWENGNDIIPLKKLVKFCNLYNYSIDYITCLKEKNIFSIFFHISIFCQTFVSLLFCLTFFYNNIFVRHFY